MLLNVGWRCRQSNTSMGKNSKSLGFLNSSLPMALIGELRVNGNKTVALDIHGIQQEWEGEEGLVPSCSRRGEACGILWDPRGAGTILWDRGR